MDPWIAAILTFFLKAHQLRPLMLRRDLISSFRGYHDPREPTTSGKMFPRVIYLSTLRRNAASMLAGVSYETATSSISRAPAYWSSTSGRSDCPGTALLMETVSPFLVSSRWSRLRTVSWRLVARTNPSRQLLSTWCPSSSPWQHLRQDLSPSAYQWYPRSGKIL